MGIDARKRAWFQQVARLLPIAEKRSGPALMQATLARQKGTTVAATKIAPPSIIAQAGTALLEQIAARSSIDQEAAANAVGKAMEQLIAGVRHRREGAIFFFTSRSREGRIEHRTDRHSCSCEAGREGIACWHRAARHLIITLMQQQECASAQATE